MKDDTSYIDVNKMKKSNKQKNEDVFFKQKIDKSKEKGKRVKILICDL